MKLKIEISAGGIVFKKERGRFVWLTTQHSLHKGWTFPKGLIGDNIAGEAKEEAALREVGEEGGIKAKITYPEPVTVHYDYRFKEFSVKKTVYYFLMEYLSGDPKNHDWEVSDARFLPADEIEKLLTYQSDREAFEKILEIFKKIGK